MFDCHFNFFVTLIIYLTISLSLISRSSILVKDFYKHSNINTIHTWLVALFFLKILTSRDWNRNDKGSKTKMIFSQNLFLSLPNFIACRNWCSNFSVLGPRQLALPVEIGVPISLCWGLPTRTLL